MENSERDGNTRPPDLPLVRCMCTLGYIGAHKRSTPSVILKQVFVCQLPPGGSLVLPSPVGEGGFCVAKAG